VEERKEEERTAASSPSRERQKKSSVLDILPSGGEGGGEKEERGKRDGPSRNGELGLTYFYKGEILGEYTSSYIFRKNSCVLCWRKRRKRGKKKMGLAALLKLGADHSPDKSGILGGGRKGKGRSSARIRVLNYFDFPVGSIMGGKRKKRGEGGRKLSPYRASVEKRKREREIFRRMQAKLFGKVRKRNVSQWARKNGGKRGSGSRQWSGSC